jgi:hypothetical protein
MTDSESFSLSVPSTPTSKVSPEIISFLRGPKAVMLYYSEWSSPALYPGKVQVSLEGNGLTWSSPRDPLKHSLTADALSCGRLVYGSEALSVLDTLIGAPPASSAGLTLCLVLDCTLCLVFDAEPLFHKWKLFLSSLMQSSAKPPTLSRTPSATPALVESCYSDVQYGAIFDISECGASLAWREVKLTFVKEDSAMTEFVNYDSSRPC